MKDIKNLVLKIPPVIPKHRIGRKRNIYIPGGSRCNVKSTIVRNPKVAAQVQAMHEAWSLKKFGRVL